MAACGAKILHLRCVEYARRENVPIHVRSSFSHKPGTWVCDPDFAKEHEEMPGMEEAIISWVRTLSLTFLPARAGALTAVLGRTFVAAGWAFAMGWGMYKALDALMGLRASTEHEQRGLDYTEHYEIGYGEFMAARTHRDLGGEH